ILASESRVRRRLLARSFREVIRAAGSDTRRIRRVVPSRSGEPYYVFLAVGPPPPGTATHEEYRQYRGDLLSDYCVSVLGVYEEANVVVGLATEGDGRDGRSFDLVLVDRNDLSAEDLEAARRTSVKEGWFVRAELTH